MKLYCRLLSFLIISSLMLVSCNDDNENPIATYDFLFDGDLISFIETNRESENYLTSYSTKEFKGVYINELIFENKDTIRVNRDEIIDVQIDRKSWIITFDVLDGSSISTYIIPSTLKNDILFDLDPFDSSPLTGILSLNTPIKGHLKTTVLGKKDGGLDLGHAEENKSSFEIPVMGLYANYENQLVIQFINPVNNNIRISDTLLVVTDVPGISNYSFNIQSNEIDQENDWMYVIADQKVGYDQNGDIRWAYTGGAQYFLRRLNDGNMLFTLNDVTNYYHTAGFKVVSPLGKTLKEYLIPNRMHHDVIQMPNGNFLAATNSFPIAFGDGNPEEDMIVEVDQSSGEIINSWDFNGILQPTRPYLPSSRNEDWLHINAIVYDEADRSIIISGRSQSVIVKIDYDTKALKWILGDHGNWNPDFQSFLLESIPNNEFSDFWSYGNHAPVLLNNGNIMLFDNGDHRGWHSNQTVAAKSYSRIVEYNINENEMTVSIDWVYDANQNYFTQFTGDVDINTDESIVMASFLWGDKQSPLIIETDKYTGQVLFKAIIGGSGYYRAEKIKLYPQH